MADPVQQPVNLPGQTVHYSYTGPISTAVITSIITAAAFYLVPKLIDELRGIRDEQSE